MKKYTKIIYKINFIRVKPVSLTTYKVFNMEDYNVFYLDLSEDDITTLNISKILNSDIDIIIQIYLYYIL